ncbi:MAG TPA: hypothetical protein VHT50_09940 [Mycobacterium sp.]|nr:hypothetical protein [Mycobacterium sp.]
MSGSDVPRLLVYCDDADHSQDRVDPRRVSDAGVDHLPDDVVIVAAFERRPDVGWIVDPFSARWGGRVRNPHRNTVQYIDASGSKIALAGMDLHRQTDAVTRARALAGSAGDQPWRMGLRYWMSCPVCHHHEVRRGGDKMHAQFDAVAAHGVSAVSLAGLNIIDRDWR